VNIMYVPEVSSPTESAEPFGSTITCAVEETICMVGVVVAFVAVIFAIKSVVVTLQGRRGIVIASEVPPARAVERHCWIGCGGACARAGTARRRRSERRSHLTLKSLHWRG
jgi:hypothetical protein